MKSEIMQKETKYSNRRKFRVVSIFIICGISFVSFFTLILSGFNPIIVGLILLFFSLIIIGSLYSRKQKSLYNQMFPDKKRNKPLKYITKRRKQRLNTKTGDKEKIKESTEVQLRIFKPLSLETKISKPLIIKCENCGMLMANFVEICPKCKEKITY